MKAVILLGGGGHARVLASVLRRLNSPILGIVDPNLPAGSDHIGTKVLGDDSAILAYQPHDIELVNGIGSLPGDSGLREKLFRQFREYGYPFKTVIDPTAFVASDVELSEGVQVLTGAIIQTGTSIAYNSIINSGAIVEHDCQIGDHVHIAPGAMLSGGVEVGNQVHIGTGAIVIQGISIGDGSVIGAGSTVTRNIGNQRIVYPTRSVEQDYRFKR